MTNQTPEPRPVPDAEQNPEQPESAIYLGVDGQYHDNTPENRDAYPAAADAPEDQPEGVPTGTEASTPEAPADADTQPAKNATAKTRDQ